MCAQYTLVLLLSLPLTVTMTNCTRCVCLYAFVCGGIAGCSVDQCDFFPLKKSERELRLTHPTSSSFYIFISVMVFLVLRHFALTNMCFTVLAAVRNCCLLSVCGVLRVI